MINFIIKLGKSSDMIFKHPPGTFLHDRESWASLLEIMFTSKPHMSLIFHIVRHLSWKNIQPDE